MAEERDEFLSRTTGCVRKRRRDGRTRRDIDTFLDHLRVTGSIASAAAAIGKSRRVVYNLREIDPEFDTQVIAARAEMRDRVESKIALYAETGGSLPPLDESGAPMEAPLEQFDPHLAMAYLKYLDAKEQGRGRRGGPQPKVVGKEELVQVLVRLFGMVQRRLAMRAAG